MERLDKHRISPRDVTEKNELFIVLLIAGIGFATIYMGIVFVIGIIVRYIIRKKMLKYKSNTLSLAAWR